MQGKADIESLVSDIKSHRSYTHPIFDNWIENDPDPQVLGALFHQIQSFCASTRPGGEMPNAMRKHGLDESGHLIDEIVESEDGHGVELATMASHIINKAAGKQVFNDPYNQQVIEDQLKEYSDSILRSLPGWSAKTGLLPQTKRAVEIFSRRNLTEKKLDAHEYRHRSCSRDDFTPSPHPRREEVLG